jgi:hypothetical protein
MHVWLRQNEMIPSKTIKMKMVYTLITLTLTCMVCMSFSVSTSHAYILPYCLCVKNECVQSRFLNIYRKLPFNVYTGQFYHVELFSSIQPCIMTSWTRLLLDLKQNEPIVWTVLFIRSLFRFILFHVITIPVYTNLAGALLQNCVLRNDRVTSTVPGVTFGGAWTLITWGVMTWKKWHDACFTHRYLIYTR